jgi:molybdenum cofactor synthesis domain-containing protein
MIRVGILTVSDLGSRGEREDTAGKALKEKVEEMGWSVGRYEIVPDEMVVISDRLREWADDTGFQLILTTGGTGFADRDVTPEATLEVLDKQTPGIPEAMRAAGLKKTPMSILSRGVAGIRGRTLILNLPGSMKGAVESLEAVREALPHAIDVILGRPGH